MLDNYINKLRFEMKVGLLLFLLAYSITSNAVVLQGDSRQQVLSPTDPKAEKVGLLVVWNNDELSKKSGCSAANISSKYIITAAHCVIDPKTAKQYDNIVYYPKHVSQLTRSPSRVFIKKAYVHSDYLEANKKQISDSNAGSNAYTTSMVENNIAILEAFSDYSQKHVGTMYGWFDIAAVDNYLNNSNIVDVFLRSYPGEKDYGTLWYEACLMKKDSDFTIVSCDTDPGTSGAAVTVMGEKDWQIIGVYSASDTIRITNNVALITPKIRLALKAIFNGTNENGSVFTKLNISTEPFYNFYIENKCYKDIKVALRLQKTDNSWETYESYQIRLNQRTLPAPDSNNTIYYYYATTHDGTQWWGDKENGITKYAFGEERPFYRKVVPKNRPIRWGDYYRQVSCD